MTPSTTQPRLLPQGVYVPTLAFFKNEDELDLDSTQRHAVFLAKSGVAGLVVHGSNGEAVHLTTEERSAAIKATRTALDGAGFSSMPVIAGVATQSTRETIALSRDAAAAGATHVIALPPAYYGGLLNTKKIVQYFHDLAEASPIPVVIYNYPGACSGLDLSSDTILDISKHANVVGVKLTCGNTGKLARVVADAKPGFFVGGGSADFILQGAVVGSSGTIAGTANLLPRACVRVLDLYAKGDLEGARSLQASLAKADWITIKTGFAGVKAALGLFKGYGGVPRKPCTPPDAETLAMIEEGFSEPMALEAKLA